MAKSAANDLENYLRDQVQQLGGDTRKWVSPMRVGVPDQIVILTGKIVFAEIKTFNDDLKSWQEREHRRLRALGATVTVLWEYKGVDMFIIDLTLASAINHEYK